MKAEFTQAARDWLQETGYQVVFEKDGHSLVGRREDGRQPREVGVVLVCLATLQSGIAQARLNTLGRWKARGAGRWIGILVDSAVQVDQLLGVKGYELQTWYPVELLS